VLLLLLIFAFAVAAQAGGGFLKYALTPALLLQPDVRLPYEVLPHSAGDRMNRNLEIKARVEDTESMRRRVEAMADSGPVVIRQVDTFFKCSEGRLKLREVPGADAELIFYDRPDSTEPAESRYSVISVSDPAGLIDALSRALGVKTVVRKVRNLYHSGNTRIHLDQVEDLGDFLELEVVLSPGKTSAEGARTAQDLMKRLGIRPADLVEVAYADLLQVDAG
jgi:predicted adenylyl cyclase CyaB